jgi:cytidylate kinase
MQIICVSRGSQNLGKEFACDLAQKLGYECVSREDLLEEATSRGIPIGKLETAIVKPHIYSERLALELEHYKALVTSILCQKALDHDIVYHGRTGHLLLPGVDHILKIRVVSDMEHRIESVMDKLGLSREKAKRYIEAVEDDRRKWVRKFYNVDWDIYTLYDLVLNIGQVAVGNAASAACAVARLPEFQSTPASTNVLKDLHLAAKARLALAADEKTGDMTVKVKANKGIVYVTYGFQQAEKANDISETLRGLPDAKQVVCTQAQTNLLWIQEAFDVDESAYGHVISLANTWDAAVEILKMTPGEEFEPIAVEAETAKRGLDTWRKTGIIDDVDSFDSPEPPDVSKIYEKLINDGRAGGKRSVHGSQRTLLNSIDRSASYRLIVLDNLFLSKGAQVRKRLIQEWSNTLSDSLKTPVVTLEDIRSKYDFGVRQFIKMLTFGILTALIVALVFMFDDPILTFLGREGTAWRIIAAALILIFIPIFAYIYSSVTGLLLRMLKFE